MPTTFPATNPKPIKRIVLFCGVAALVLAGCGDETKSQDGDLKSTTSSTATTTTTAPTTYDCVDRHLGDHGRGSEDHRAQRRRQGPSARPGHDAGRRLYHLTSHDSTGQARLQVLDRNWLVTDQAPAAGSSVAGDQLIDLGARKFTD